MRRVCGVLVAILIGLQGFAQQAVKPATPDETAIVNILLRQQADWNRGDIPAFMIGYWQSDSLSFTGKSGTISGYDNTLKRYLANYDSPEKMGRLQFTILRLTPLGPDHYSMIGRFELTRTMGDASGYFTLIWRRVNGEWKIISDHTS